MSVDPERGRWDAWRSDEDGDVMVVGWLPDDSDEPPVPIATLAGARCLGRTRAIRDVLRALEARPA